MKKIIILVFLVTLIVYILNQNLPTLESTENNKNSIQIEFQFDNNDIFSVEYYNKSKNLFSIIQNITQQQGWDFTWEDYGDVGLLITKIKDKENGQNNKYWQYFADNEQVLLSADKYYPTNQNFIVWKFQKSEF